MFSSSAGYQSYIFRFWPEHTAIDQTILWHFSLEDIETKAHYCFQEFSDLIDFLGARKMICEKDIKESCSSIVSDH